MKKLIGVLTFLIFFLGMGNLVAQDDQIIGGKFSFDQIKYQENLQSYVKLAVTLQPHYARFLSQRVMLTGDMGIDYERVTVESLLSPGINYFNFTITPGLRYYLNDGTWKCFVFGAEQVAFLSQYSDAKSFVNVSNFKHQPQVGFGANRLIAPNLALDFISVYSPYSDSLNLNVGLQSFVRKQAAKTVVVKDSSHATRSVVGKGVRFIGGSIHGNVDTKTGKYYFNFSPEYGIFFREGLYLGLNTSMYVHGEHLSDSHTSFYAIPNFKYYKSLIGHRFFLTLEGSAAYQTNQKTVNGFSIAGAVGVSLFITREIALEITGIQYSKIFSSNDTGFGSGPAIGFGFGIKSYID